MKAAICFVVSLDTQHTPRTTWMIHAAPVTGARLEASRIVRQSGIPGGAARLISATSTLRALSILMMSYSLRIFIAFPPFSASLPVLPGFISFRADVWHNRKLLLS